MYMFCFKQKQVKLASSYYIAWLIYTRLTKLVTQQACI